RDRPHRDAEIPGDPRRAPPRRLARQGESLLRVQQGRRAVELVAGLSRTDDPPAGLNGRSHQSPRLHERFRDMAISTQLTPATTSASLTEVEYGSPIHNRITGWLVREARLLDH